MIDWIVCPHCAGAGTYKVKNNPGWICAFNTRTCDGCNGRGVVPVAVKPQKESVGGEEKGRGQ